MARVVNAVSWRMRRLRFRLRHEFLRAAPYILPYNGFQVVYESGDVLVRSYSIRGHWERHVSDYVAAVLPREAEVVDVGANIGLFAFGVLKSRPEAYVHLFQPSPRPQRCLAASLRRNGLSARARLNPLALYSEVCELDFHVHEGGHSAFDGIRDTGYPSAGAARPVRVRATTLDRYCQEGELTRLDLLKLDAEGAELLILRGAQQTLRALRPRVLFEVGLQNLAPYAIRPADLHQFFTSCGYVTQTLRRESLGLEQFERAVETEHEFAAVPREVA